MSMVCLDDGVLGGVGVLEGVGGWVESGIARGWDWGWDWVEGVAEEART